MALDPVFEPALGLTTGLLVYAVRQFAVHPHALEVPFSTGDCTFLAQLTPHNHAPQKSKPKPKPKP